MEQERYDLYLYLLRVVRFPIKSLIYNFGIGLHVPLVTLQPVAISSSFKIRGSLQTCTSNLSVFKSADPYLYLCIEPVSHSTFNHPSFESAV